MEDAESKWRREKHYFILPVFNLVPCSFCFVNGIKKKCMILFITICSYVTAWPQYQFPVIADRNLILQFIDAHFIYRYIIVSVIGFPVKLFILMICID